MACAGNVKNKSGNAKQNVLEFEIKDYKLQIKKLVSAFYFYDLFTAFDLRLPAR